MSQSSARRSSGRAAQRRAAKNKTNRSLIIGGAVGLIAIMVVVGLLLANQSPAIGEKQPDQSNPHIGSENDPHPAYSSNPPTSGWHTGGNIGPWGVTTQPIADEITIHNLEHGGIIIHYRQDLDAATLEQLTSLTRQLQGRSPCVLQVPRPTDKLDVPIAVTAWNWLLKLPAFDANQIQAFFEQHVNEGPEKVGCQLRS
jgi:hypothetical protein